MSKIATPKEVTARFDVKNIKSGFGHDNMGLHADIYLDNRKVGYFDDDGWGGGAQIHWDNKEAEKLLHTILTQINFAKIMHENGWNFLKLEEITIHQQEECCLDDFISNKQEDKEMEKFRKKMEKAMVTHLIIGTSLDSGSYRPVGWKGKTIQQVVTQVGVEKFINIVKTQVKLNPGEKILNTNLAELGVNLD